MHAVSPDLRTFRKFSCLDAKDRLFRCKIAVFENKKSCDFDNAQDFITCIRVILFQNEFKS